MSTLKKKKKQKHFIVSLTFLLVQYHLNLIQFFSLLTSQRVSLTDDSWFSFLRRDWDILIMDALLHVPANDEKHQTLRISISDTPAPAFAACTDCKPQEPEILEKK